ncbi:MAG: tetratricopeptide repeat protein [Bradymonadia bacterium]
MDTQFIRISDIPVYEDNRSEAAFLYHVTRYQRWLSTAGASPRVAATLCSSAEQLDDLINHLEAKEVDVMSLEASDARPIPEAVLRHQGDHFNRTLFVVSGLDSQPDDSTLFSRMNQYVEHYAKVATWVLFVVPDARTLVRFAQQAPDLWQHVMRCVPIAGDVLVQSPSPRVMGGRLLEPRLRYAQTVSDGLNGQLTPQYHVWSRVCRTGYLHGAMAHESEVDDTALSLWRLGLHQSSVSETISEWMQELQRRHNERGHYPWVSPQVHRTEDRFLVKQLAQMHMLFKEGQAPDSHNIATFRENYGRHTSPDLNIEASFVDAQLYALNDDYEAMTKAFEKAIELVDKASLEAGFEALYRLAEVYLLLERRTDARLMIDRLETFEPQLMSPFYEGRLLFLKGCLLSKLDRRKGEEILSKAHHLFVVHGYPQYAAQTNEQLSG